MSRYYSKLYLFFWKYPIITVLLSFIKGIFVGVCLISLIGCAGKYEVVQQLRVNMYHLQNVKTKDVEIILTSDSLKVGDILKKNHIRIIAEINKE